MLRLFVAAYPPPQVAEQLVEELRSLELPSHRGLAADQVHLTLQFIGDTPPARLDEVRESLRRSAAGLAGFELRPLRLITLPERGPARLVAAETDAPAALLEIQRRLAARLARHPRPRAGDRFRPHLTLCRFRSPARIARIAREIAAEPFAVREVVLMRSTLLPEGARHDRVAAVELTPPV
jgi:2'-5' RNA ligase